MNWQQNQLLDESFQLGISPSILSLEQNDPPDIESSSSFSERTLKSGIINNDEKKRISNHIFKTPLSMFFRTTCIVLRKNKRNRIYGLFKDIYQTKNKGTFPKLVVMLKQFDLLKEVNKEWNEQIKAMNKYEDEKKEKAIQNWIMKMNFSMMENHPQDIFDFYWGKHDEDSETKYYLRSLKDFLTFQEQMRKKSN